MPYLDKRPSPQITNIFLRDIDQSVVNWFNKDFPLMIDGHKVNVMYATAERWARMQKEKGYRDESGILILPLISVRRTTPDNNAERYVPDSDETNITLTKRIATTPISNNDPQPAIINNTQIDPFYQNVKDKAIYEVMQIPFPSFVNLDYEVTVWTSYMTHQNIEQENIYREWKSGRTWVKVNGFYFFAQLKGVSDQSNLEDFSDKEKIIRYNFKLMVQAYLINQKNIKTFRTSTNVIVKVSETSYPIKQ